MARTQRSDHESFPTILIFLLILTSVGTISFIFFGGGQGTIYSTTTRASRNSKDGISENLIIEKPLSLVRGIIAESVLDAEVIYIIPGGGSGSDLLALDYPEWSKQRVIAAHRHSLEKLSEDKKSIFLALSAGSLNAPNLLQPDGRVVFECQFMIAHLLELEVASDRIFGDTMSWDTVSNAQVARQFLEGLLALRKPIQKQKQLKNNKKKKRSFREENSLPDELIITSSPLQVEIFISDFHAERVKAAFNWVLSLEPSLFEGRSITVAVHSVSTEDITWSDRTAYEVRQRHEEEGVQQILHNSKIITTMAEFNAFILLGGHTGFDSYVKNSYQVSQGAGWSI